jgi:hypothetical protein
VAGSARWWGMARAIPSGLTSGLRAAEFVFYVADS